MSQEFPKLLHECAGRQVVALSQSFEPGKMRELRADMSSSGVELVKFCRDFSLDFNMDVAEMDNLCKAWQALRDAQRQAEEEARQRMEQIKARAFALAEKHSIRIEPVAPDPEPAWDVSIPSTGFAFYGAAKHVEDLLGQVQTCVEIMEKQPA